MKKFKKAIMIGAIVLAVGASSSTVLAASAYSNPVEALAGITGKTVESVLTEQYQTGKSLGVMANDAGKLDEFQKELLEMRKDALAQRVESGNLTQQQADQMIISMEENQAYCYGVGYGGGQGMMGAGNGGGMFGRGQGGCGGFGYTQAR